MCDGTSDPEDTGAHADRQQRIDSLATICVTILSQPDDATTPAIDTIVDQLRTVSCADSTCSAAM